MTEQEFINYGIKVIQQYPQLKEDVEDAYSIAICEIEDGESESHEWDLAEGSIAELVEYLQ